MGFESNSVVIRYVYESNATRVLGDMAKQAAQTSRVLKSLKLEVSESDKAFRDLGRSVSSVARIAARSTAPFEALTKSVQSVGRVGAETAARFDTSTRTMGSAAAATATRVAESANVITTRLNTVTVAADRAAMSMGRVSTASRAGAGGGFGGVAAAAGAGGGFLGGAATVAGYAGLITGAIGIKGAANLQSSQAQLGIGTGRSTADAAKTFLAPALALSNVTAMSLPDAMASIRTLSTFIKKPGALQDNALIEKIGKYADIQFYNKEHSAPFTESVANLGQVSHMLGAYSNKAIAPIAELMYKAGYATHGGQTKLVNQMTYFGEGYKRAGVSNDEIIKTAILGSVSLGHGKWGNAYDTLLKNITNPTKPQAVGQRLLGIRDAHGKLSSDVLDENGNFSPIGLFKQINRRTEHMGGTDAMVMFGKAFNQTAKRIVEQASSTKNLNFYKDVTKSMARMPTLEEAQAQAMDTLSGQTKRLTTNFSSLATIIAGPLVRPLTNFLTRAGDVVGSGANYLATHPAANLAATAATVGLGTLGAFKMLRAVGGIGAFIHIAEHEAKHSVGFGAGLYFRRGAHGATHGPLSSAEAVAAEASRNRSIVGRISNFGERVSSAAMRAAMDTVTFAGTRREIGALGSKIGGTYVGSSLKGAASFVGRDIGGVLGSVGAAFRILGVRALPLMTWIPRLAMFIGRLGLRAIPVVGNILMLIDILKFLGAHAKDIGYGIGVAVKWIRTEGVRLVIEGFKSLIMGIADFVKSSIVGLFNGGHGGIFDVAKSAIAGFNAGNADAPKPGQRISPPKPSQQVSVPHVARPLPRQHAFLANTPPAYVPLGGSAGSGIQVHGDIHVTPAKGNTVEDVHRELLRHIRNEAPAHQTPMIPSVRSGVLMGTA